MTSPTFSFLAFLPFFSLAMQCQYIRVNGYVLHIRAYHHGDAVCLLTSRTVDNDRVTAGKPLPLQQSEQCLKNISL